MSTYRPSQPAGDVVYVREDGVGLSVRGFAIAYRIVDRGAAVEVSAIFPINY